MLIILIIIFAIVFLIAWMIDRKCDVDVAIKKEKERIIKILVRQCARWSSASVQDINPVVAYLHASYAAGYLWAMEDAFTADEISEYANIDYKNFRKEVQKNQDYAAKIGIKECPQFAKVLDGTSLMVAKIAGEL